jgi:hypothetical protein
MCVDPANDRRRLRLAILAAAAAWWSPAAAQSATSTPTLAACTPATAPQLPMRWRAVGLMMPFRQEQLDVGEFVYDGTLPAMRATVYGLESGAADLLITQDNTYLLDGPHQAPTHCTALGPKLHPPSAQWLSGDSVCVGEAPLETHRVQWWQAPGFDPARYWFSTETHLPWRSSFVSRSLDPAIIGDYAMSYFPTFTPLQETDLAALRDRCAATTEHAEVSETPTARELMTIPNKAAEAERATRIGELIPGLSHDACSRATPPRWPDQFVTTSIVTPIKITDHPFSALIYYDWSQAGTLTVLPFQGRPPVQQGVIALKNRIGYRLRFRTSGGTGVCAPVLPGIVRPDWMSAASCSCKGMIERGSPLSPNADTQILSCPIRTQGSRIMWSWYTTQGRPVMFVEAAPQGGGVMLADYHDWLPGETGQASDLALPKTCTPADAGGALPSGVGPSFANSSCSDCHTTAATP